MEKKVWKMKIKCNDGENRLFFTAEREMWPVDEEGGLFVQGDIFPAYCAHCGLKFGNKNKNTLKPIAEKHCCKFPKNQET